MSTYNNTTPQSNNWTCPANVVEATVELWGAGASGGGTGASTTPGGSGGGGGAYVKFTIVTVAGNNYPFVIGAGGSAPAAGANPGLNGNPSSFTHNTAGNTFQWVADFGKHGDTGLNGLGGAGGANNNTNATASYSGGSGCNSNAAGSNSGGGGGAGAGNANVGASASGTPGASGANGGGNGGAGGGRNGNGSAATVDSGGGGGGSGRANTTARAGGAGMGGRILITYTAQSNIAVTPAVASAATSTVDPTVKYGSTSVTPAAASATTAATGGTVYIPPPNLLQTKGEVSTAANTLADLSFNIDVSVGSDIFIFLSGATSGSTPTFNTPTKASGTATLDGAFVQDAWYNGFNMGSYSGTHRIYRAKVTGAGSLTLSFSGTFTAGGAAIAEIAGLDASPMDGTAPTATGNSATEAAGAVTTSVAGVVVEMGTDGASGTLVYSFSDSPIYSATDTSKLTMSVQAKFTDSPGSYNPSVGMNQTAPWGAMTQAYKNSLGVSVTPAAASASTAAIAPTVLYGSTSATPAAASVSTAAVAPTVVHGSLSLAPTAASVSSAAIAPAVVHGSLSLSPAVGSAASAAIAPAVIQNSMVVAPAAATMASAAIAPAVVHGSLVLSPDVASAASAAIPPTVLAGGGVTLTPAAASTVTTAVPPNSIGGGAATDNFNRANGWLTLPWSSGSSAWPLQIISNKAVATVSSAAVSSVAIRTDLPVLDDQYSECDVLSLLNANFYTSLLVRSSLTEATYYDGGVSGPLNNASWYVQKSIAGSYINLVTGTGLTVNPGDKLRLEVRGQGQYTVVKLFLNGSLLGEATDSSGVHINGGYPGISLYNSGYNNTHEVDNWAGGNLATLGVFAPAPAELSGVVGFGAVEHDDFNRTDENPLAGFWLTQTGSHAVKIASQQAQATVADVSAGSTAVRGDVWPNDQFSEFKVVAALNSSFYAIAITRASQTAQSNYRLVIRGPLGSGATWYFDRAWLGSYTNLSTAASLTINAGDVVRLEVRGQGDTTTVKFYLNGSLISTVTDNFGGTKPTSGAPGFQLYNAGAAGLGNLIIDDWHGGALDVGSWVTPEIPSVGSAAVAPTVVLGSFVLTDAIASVASAAVAPTVLHGSTLSAPAAASASATAPNPGVQASGAVSLTPAAASVVTAAVAPVVALGSTTLASAIASASSAATPPTVVFGSLSLTPGSASVGTSAPNPSVGIGAITPAAAIVSTAAIAPAVVQSSMTVAPAAASMSAVAVAPAVQQSSMVVAPAAASTNSSAPNPGILAFVLLTPPAATVSTSATAPVVSYSSLLLSTGPAVLSTSSTTEVVLGSLSLSAIAAVSANVPQVTVLIRLSIAVPLRLDMAYAVPKFSVGEIESVPAFSIDEIEDVLQ